MTSMARPISGRLCNSMIITALHQIETRACHRHLDGRTAIVQYTYAVAHV